MYARHIANKLRTSVLGDGHIGHEQYFLFYIFP